MNTQPEALRLADLLERHDRISDNKWYGNKNAVAELRRLHEVNQELAEALKLVLDLFLNTNEYHAHYETVDKAYDALARAGEKE